MQCKIAFRLFVLAVVLIAVVFVQGCALLPQREAWGSRVSFPDVSRLSVAFNKAVKARATWLPFAGAVVSGVTPLDDNVSDWAMRHTPVFGSSSDALDASDDLMHFSKFCMVTSLLFTPGSSSASESLEGKLKGASVQFLAVGATNTATGILKRTTNRGRPGGGGGSNDSFPSAHASSAFVYTGLARSNVLPLLTDPVYRNLTDYSLLGVAAGTAWARVEGGVHHPSDVLFSSALGNFMAVFFNHAFNVNHDLVVPSVSLTPKDRVLMLGLQFRF